MWYCEAVAHIHHLYMHLPRGLETGMSIRSLISMMILLFWYLIVGMCLTVPCRIFQWRQKTIGIVVVAALAASTAGVLLAIITVT